MIEGFEVHSGPGQRKHKEVADLPRAYRTQVHSALDSVGWSHEKIEIAASTQLSLGLVVKNQTGSVCALEVGPGPKDLRLHQEPGVRCVIPKRIYQRVAGSGLEYRIGIQLIRLRAFIELQSAKVAADTYSMPRGQVKNHFAFDIAEINTAGFGIVIVANFTDGARQIIKQARARRK